VEAVKFYEDEVKKRDQVRQYLEGRGLNPGTIKTWHLGYAPADWRPLTTHLKERRFSQDEIVKGGLAIMPEKKGSEAYDRFRGRIMFPINDVTGRPIAFSGRFFENMPPRGGEKNTHTDSEPA